LRPADRDDRGANDEVLFTYRSFAGIVGVIAAFLVGIVAVAAGACCCFSIKARRYALVAAVRRRVALLIAMLVPRVNVTLFENRPALVITQRAVFPLATAAVTTPNGAQLAELRKSVLSASAATAGRSRRKAATRRSPRGIVLRRALRKFFGKFSRG
jgi:hypothetical protein